MACVSLNGVTQLLDFQNVVQVVSWVLFCDRKQIVLQVLICVGLELTEKDYVLIILEREVEAQGVHVCHWRLIFIVVLIIREALRVILVICL